CRQPRTGKGTRSGEAQLRGADGSKSQHAARNAPPSEATRPFQVALRIDPHSWGGIFVQTRKYRRKRLALAIRKGDLLEPQRQLARTLPPDAREANVPESPVLPPCARAPTPQTRR